MSTNSEEREFLIRLGKRIASLREQSGLSSAETARRLYMERSNYSRIETGNTNPTSLTLWNLSKVLGCSIDEFFK
ncbi:helix-turn-helix transcriptional regulator [Ekhidna sp.]|jgi:transcriptional regulator with XRE-family HTH domain|uniref:helix-turn-helix domain-containing protein n=1 Tax=Ekhidna sp. TaxID=2608089 RepID=UPI0032ECA30B